MSRQKSEGFIEEARLLLPWYLTNTLSDDEQELVNKALEASPELRKEFVREEKMMRLVKENTSLLELSALDTTEQRLENTFARIDREEQQHAKLTAEISSSSDSHHTAEKSGWLKRLFGGGLFNVEWLTPANAAFASLLALQVGVLGYYHSHANDGGSTVYETVTYPKNSLPATDVSKSVKSAFLMEFHNTAEYGEVCEFLNNWNAQIISGPDSNNMFMVEMNTDPNINLEALAETIMSKASTEDMPVVFVGPQFKALQ